MHKQKMLDFIIVVLVVVIIMYYYYFRLVHKMPKKKLSTMVRITIVITIEDAAMSSQNKVLCKNIWRKDYINQTLYNCKV